MQTQTIAKVKRTFRAPSEYGNRYAFTITAEAHAIGEQSPYFSVTGEIGKPGARDCEACGCLHDEAAKAWPKIRPIIALHLSDSETGEPMHAEANGYYWLAGVVGGLGEQYHGSSGTGSSECLAILADHLRITQEQAQAIANTVKDAYYDAEIEAIDKLKTEPTLNRLPQGMEQVRKAASIAARNVFHDYVNAQRDRWQTEAKAGLALIRSLNETQKPAV